MARILVLDDDEAIVRLLSRRLRTDHEVTALTSPRKAIFGIEAGARFDAIFSDLNMPEMGGVEFLMAVSRIDPEQARRIVFTPKLRPGFTLQRPEASR